MDSTYLFKTGHTADETQIYRPGAAVLDQSILSQQINQGQSRTIISRPVPTQSFPQPSPQYMIAQPRQISSQPVQIPSQPVRQQVVSRSPFGSNATYNPLPVTITRNVPQPIPLPHLMQNPQPIIFGNPRLNIRPQDQILVYCPVCRRDYLAYQADIHAQIHNQAGRYNFNTIQVSKNNQLDVTVDSISDQKLGNASSFPSVQYPLVQPLQFWTSELSDSAKNDVFIFKQNKNYDGVDHQYFNPPPPPPPVVIPVIPPKQIIKPQPVVPVAPIQPVEPVRPVLVKPPLQYESNDTNLYNCFDNIVNRHNGPKFSMSDITSKNKIITPKRPLQQYILERKNNPNSLINTNNTSNIRPYLASANNNTTTVQPYSTINPVSSNINDIHNDAPVSKVSTINQPATTIPQTTTPDMPRFKLQPTI